MFFLALFCRVSRTMGPIIDDSIEDTDSGLHLALGIRTASMTSTNATTTPPTTTTATTTSTTTTPASRNCVEESKERALVPDAELCTDTRDGCVYNCLSI